MRKLRPRKDGALTMCSSPDNKVGHGRCNHILEDGKGFSVVYRKKDKCYYVNLNSDDKVEEVVKLEKEEKIISDFFKKLQDSVSQEDKEKIIKFLRDQSL